MRPYTDPWVQGAFGSGDTNLAPIIRQDGSLLGLGRPGWVWKATDWRNLSTYATPRRPSIVFWCNGGPCRLLCNRGHVDAVGLTTTKPGRGSLAGGQEHNVKKRPTPPTRLMVHCSIRYTVLRLDATVLGEDPFLYEC